MNNSTRMELMGSSSSFCNILKELKVTYEQIAEA